MYDYACCQMAPRQLPVLVMLLLLLLLLLYSNITQYFKPSTGQKQVKKHILYTQPDNFG